MQQQIDMDIEDLLADSDRLSANISQELIWHVAAGLEDPQEVAKRYGYDEAKWSAIKDHKPFVLAVEAQRAEFEANGFTFRNKMRLVSSDLAERLYIAARSSDTTVGQLHEIFKTVTRLADLEPKQEKAALEASGPQFSISINLSGAPTQTIDITPKQIEDD